MRKATLLGPGRSVLGLGPVKSELSAGGGEERFRFQGNSRVTPLGALPPLRGEESTDLGVGRAQVSVWLSLLAARWPCQDIFKVWFLLHLGCEFQVVWRGEEGRDRVWERTI